LLLQQCRLLAEALIIAILNVGLYYTVGYTLYASFHSLCYLMCRKVKSFKQVVFLSEQCAVSKLTTTVRSAVFWSWHRPTILLLLVYDSGPVSRFITCCNAATARCYQHGAAGPHRIVWARCAATESTQER